jgi:hypothetical protein
MIIQIRPYFLVSALKTKIAFWFLVLLVFISRTNSVAQEMWGASNSNYAGQMGLELNPASIVGAPYKWEIHVLSMDASLLNNYMYLSKNSKIIRKSFAGEAVEEDRITDRFTKSDKWAYSSAFLKYPGFIWVGKKYSFGFHASTRFELSAQKVPYHLAKFMKEGFDYDPLQQQNFEGGNTSMAILNWHEIGVTAGMVLTDDKTNYLTGAVTLNYNYGLNAYFVNLNDFKYNSQYDSLLIVDNINMQYGHSWPDGVENGVAQALQRKGKGYSTTVGFQYYKNRNESFYNPCSRQKGIPYDYKIGFSIMDIGYIKYNKNARTFKFDDLSTDWYGIDTVQLDGSATTDSVLGKQFYGVFLGARDKREFTLLTPGAVNLTFDKPLGNNFYANVAIIQRLPLGKMAVKRANQVALTARYETRRFEVALPISVYEYFKPRIGLSIRYGGFILGSDMLGPFFGFTDSYGADLFFGYSIRHFGKCDGRNKGRVKKVKIEDCFKSGK